MEVESQLAYKDYGTSHEVDANWQVRPGTDLAQSLQIQNMAVPSVFGIPQGEILATRCATRSTGQYTVQEHRRFGRTGYTR